MSYSGLNSAGALGSRWRCGFPASEMLTDFFVADDGSARIVWSFTRESCYRFHGFLEHDDPMDEHRITTRHRVLKAGTIEFGGGAIDCTVRNISAAGAALDVTSPLGIPAQFTLVTEGNHLPCRVVWRKEKRIGVTFDQKP